MMRVFLRFAVAAVLVAGLGGCTGVSYYAQSVNGHLEMLSARQPVAKLVYEDMAGDPAALYGGKSSNYQGQRLKLSKHFA